MVKAFNTTNWRILGDAGRPDGGDDRLALFVAGDDADAKARVSALIEEIGFAPVDTGALANGGRLQQPGSKLYTEDFTVPDARAALDALEGARTP